MLFKHTSPLWWDVSHFDVSSCFLSAIISLSATWHRNDIKRHRVKIHEFFVDDWGHAKVHLDDWGLLLMRGFSFFCRLFNRFSWNLSYLTQLIFKFRILINADDFLFLNFLFLLGLLYDKILVLLNLSAVLVPLIVHVVERGNNFLATRRAEISCAGF